MALSLKLKRAKAPVLAIAVILLCAGFLLAPWSFETKAHAALHGLCSQRPSHSLQLGGRVLPFDARMTGIYGGFFTTALYFLVRCRYLAVRLPPRRVLAALFVGVASMAIDGTNSLLVDLGGWHPYQPLNAFRLVTGLLTGTTLATTLCFVVATTLWRTGWSNRSPITGLRDLSLIALLQTPFAAVVTSGQGLLYMPAVVLLLASATMAIATIAGVVLVLLRKNDGQYRTVGDVEPTAVAALVVGVVIMVSAAIGRFALEAWLEIPALG